MSALGTRNRIGVRRGPVIKNVKVLWVKSILSLGSIQHHCWIQIHNWNVSAYTESRFFHAFSVQGFKYSAAYTQDIFVFSLADMFVRQEDRSVELM